MKLFLSWSGPMANTLALAVKRMIVDVFPHVECYLSSEAVPGSQWLPDLEGALKESDACLLFVTPETAGSVWCAFEAGAHWAKDNLFPIDCWLSTSDKNASAFRNLTFSPLDQNGLYRLFEMLAARFDLSCGKDFGSVFDKAWIAANMRALTEKARLHGESFHRGQQNQMVAMRTSAAISGQSRFATIGDAQMVAWLIQQGFMRKDDR